MRAKLAANAVERRTGEKTKNPSLLSGLLFDAEGHRMTPTHAVKRGTRYRYYVSRPLISSGRTAGPDGLRIPAGEIERLVVARLGEFFSEPARVADALTDRVETAAQQRHLLQRAADLAASWSALPVVQRRSMLADLFPRIVVRADRVEVELLPSRIASVLHHDSPGPIATDPASQQEPPIVLNIPAQLRRAGLGIRMLIDEAGSPGRAAKADPKLIKLIARAHLFNKSWPRAVMRNWPRSRMV